MLMCVLALSGVKVHAQSVTNNGNTITFSGYTAGNLAAALGNADLSGVTKIVFDGCALNEEDFNALNSTTTTGLASVVTVDLNSSTVESINTMSGMNLEGVEHLRLPYTMTNAEDVVAMKSLKSTSKNASLKMVGTFDGRNVDWSKISLYSFQENTVQPFLRSFGLIFKDTETPIANAVKEVRMAGEYGDKDLYDGGYVFGSKGVAIWDFTGSHFADCDVDLALPSNKYYNYNDPFCENGKVTFTSPYHTNAFYYFRMGENDKYTNGVIDIKLPDVNMTSLPYGVLRFLGAGNKNNYITYNNITQADFEEKYGNSQGFAPIETLVIPDSYTDLDVECGYGSKISHLILGNGKGEKMVIHGGAFSMSEIEDLDFSAGISECWIGDNAFYRNENMKHIALSEGIVSIGNQAFFRSQHLESIRLPQSLLYIGNEGFFNCLALNSITIPENVDKIGKKAFKECPFTDIFLTTTDPEKIPLMWSAGTTANGYGVSEDCTFYTGHMNAWGGIEGFREDKKELFKDMTWEQATDYYYIHANGLPVLHYPEALAEKVRASISKTYYAASSEGYGLPIYKDVAKRGNIPDADLGGTNGKYTRDGWAQFLLMKEFTTNPGDDVYQKDYKDVWYTMCFPFDLTDEQLAAAFNETFNIVDFSGIEVTNSTSDDGKEIKTFTLHFNNVALTDYKDTNDKHYKRKTDANGVVRVQHENFEYNVYIDSENPSIEYWHVVTSDKLKENKTKTFAKGTSLQTAKSNYEATGEAFIIDGILATAGHPYMIHPAIGVKAGSPAKRCTFAGISWLPQGSTAGKPLEGWRILFEKQSRTIDLGEKKDETITEYADSNYNQKQHAGYGGQKYTFIGNYHEYDNSVLTAGIEDEPQVPEKPVEPTIPTSKPTPPTTAEMQEPEKATNPDEDTDTYPAAFKTFYNTKYHIGNGVYGPVGEGISGWEFNNVASGPQNWGSYFYQLDSNHAGAAFYDYFDPTNISKRSNKDAILVTLFDSDKFQTLKEKCGAYKQALENYQGYDALYAAYLKSKKEWDDYRTQLDMYTNGKNGSAYQTYLAALSEYNDAVTNHDTWEAKVKPYKVQIPQYAYFLGTKKGDTYPKYFRETAAENYPSTRKSGLWPQFTAVIIPNTAALAGIEAELDGVTQSHNGSKIAFNEDYFIIDEFGPQGIATVIENAKRENPDTKVEHIDIVVSIDGKVVSRDKTTFEGLPKGVYIVNGKKYYVK